MILIEGKDILKDRHIFLAHRKHCLCLKNAITAIEKYYVLQCFY